MGPKSQSRVALALWTRSVSALLASIAFHSGAIYLAQGWLLSHAVTPVAALNVRLPEKHVTPVREDEPLMNTIETEEEASAETKGPPTVQDRGKPAALPVRRLEKLLTRLSDKLPYPPEALAAGWEGETVLAVEIDGRAQIVSVSVVSSSGYAVLDEAALRAVGNLRSLGADLRSKSVLFPVRFELN